MNSFLTKYKNLIIAALSFILSWGFYIYFIGVDIKKESEKFQNQIIRVDKELKKYAQLSSKVIAESTIDDLWESNNFKDKRFNIHAIQDNELVFWNENTFPISQLLEREQKLENGVHSLDNGFYLVNRFDVYDLDVLISFKIKSNYPYQNENLKNELVNELYLPSNVIIEMEDKTGIPIFDSKENILFHLSPSINKNIYWYQELTVFLLFLIGVICLFLAIGKFLISHFGSSWLVIFSFPVGLLLIRYLSIHFGWLNLFADFELFAPDLYASSELFPNLGSLIISVSIFVLIIWWIEKQRTILNKTEEKWKSSKKTFSFIAYLLLLPFSHFISWLFSSLIINSSISIEVSEIYSLDIYSLIALLIIATLFLCYYLVANRVITLLIKAGYKANILALFWFVSGVLYFIFELTLGHGHLLSAFWPIILNGVLFYVELNKKGKLSFGHGIIILAVFSAYSAYNLFEYNQINEFQKRQLYANQLISDQDPTFELEFVTLNNQIKKNKDIKKLLDQNKIIKLQQFKTVVEDCCISSFWDRYDISFYLYNSNRENNFDYISSQVEDLSRFENIIQTHGEKSEFSDNLFYIKNYHEQLSYVSKSLIEDENGKTFYLVLLFRSKKIPEEIGIPRLLINQSTQLIDDLGTYSIARYSQEGLIMRFGDYNYPVTFDKILNNFQTKKGFVDFNKYNHYINTDNENQYVIISKQQKSFFENLTNFSYLFLFYGVIILIIILSRGDGIFSFRNMPLSIKIQVIFITIVIASFILLVYVSGTFVKQQYQIYTADTLKERLHSVEIEVKQKLGDRENLDPTILGNYMEYILKKFANVFATDINLYDTKGKLLASSQPTLYNKGISSQQINADAYKALNYHKKSQLIHQESIGDLSYLAAYIPFKNKSGKMLGYINIQHFAKQRDYENQISGFLIAIVNTAVFLLVITIIIAIFISNWITIPLRMIQQSFKSVELGKQNKPIAYDGDDEIGALVKDYNNKLAELELKAMQLAKSERESAWREMAKQVAHEIKNPLTPMKLSLQHFQRSFDTDDPDAKEKLKRISDSLIEQINGLTNIANEFSNFAKMPKPNEEEVDLITLINTCVSTFKNGTNMISLNTKESEAVIFADKNLMIRVFNNILKNALQAIPDDSKPIIKLELTKEPKGYLVAITDNGIGIKPEEKNKIFVPNFTTKSTGAGLGLAMVQQIIHNHQGEIWFESTEGKGTTFFIFLPDFENKG